MRPSTVGRKSSRALRTPLASIAGVQPRLRKFVEVEDADTRRREQEWSVQPRRERIDRSERSGRERHLSAAAVRLPELDNLI